MKQYVCYSDTLSATMPITHGVLQGSILGPLSENLFSILFGDDTTLLIESTNISTMITTLNCELAKLTEWLNANKLSFKVYKSHYMVFHRSRRKINKGDILLDTTILSQVTFTKFLGVILDDKLKWTHYMGMGIILKARNVRERRSYYSYTIHVWLHIQYTVWKFGECL